MASACSVWYLLFMSPSATPDKSIAVPLVLGGHSFIKQLGTDPRPDEATAERIVAACLEQGIVWFDTTYQPERIALGRVLQTLKARNKATLLVWNFFHDFDEGGEVGGPSAYRENSLDLLCKQLQTDLLDILVVHPTGNADDDQKQEALAYSWREKGRVKRLAIWHPKTDAARGIYDLAIAPGNIADKGVDRFPLYKEKGWETLATSEIADLLLRYAAFLPGVDRLVVAIRQPHLVEKNIASVRRGPLNADEAKLLSDLFAQFGAA